MSKQLQFINLNDKESICSDKARKVLGVLDSTIIDTDTPFIQILQDLILEEWEQVCTKFILFLKLQFAFLK